MTDTTTVEIFSFLVGAMDQVGVDWAHTVILVTDGAPSMIGEKAGEVAGLREKVCAAN